MHAGRPTAERKAITGSWAVWSAEHETFTMDGDLKAQLERDHVKLIGYRPISELPQKLRKGSDGK